MAASLPAGPATSSLVPTATSAGAAILPSSSTANTWVLIATAAFAALPGAPTPDYIMPAGFFPTGGGTLNYASGADIWTYGAVPVNGTSVGLMPISWLSIRQKV